MSTDTILTVEQAQQSLTKHLSHIRAKTSNLPLMQAVGSVLAQDIYSSTDVPSANLSMMDGYAVNSQDDMAIREITQRIAAGQTAIAPLAKMCAARIFTGAMLPEGADCVVMQESVKITDKGYIQLSTPPKSGAYIRAKGSEFAKDQLVLSAGARLTPSAIALCASVGVAEVCVYQPIRVALITTGSELLEPGQAMTPGKTYNSNSFLMSALLQDYGFTATTHSIVADTLPLTIDALSKVTHYDAIISTGGVSVGEEDHVRAAVSQLGTIDAWRVKMKPGKPFAFGHVQGTPFFGLPGNPVSAFTTFHLFVLPILQDMQGLIRKPIYTIPATANFTMAVGDRRDYIRARLQIEQNNIIAEAYPNQNSSVVESLYWANGMIPLAEHQHVKQGDQVDFIPINQFKQ